MSLQVTVTVPNLSRAVREASYSQINKRAQRYARQLETEVVTVIRAKLNTTRVSTRRRNPDSQHIDEGWTAHVVGDPGTYPIMINLVSDGDGAYQKRIRMMNDGTPGHAIRPRGKKKQSKGKKGPYLQFPELGDGSVPGPPWAYAKEVSHPGTTGYHFIEQARGNVLGGISARF